MHKSRGEGFLKILSWPLEPIATQDRQCHSLVWLHWLVGGSKGHHSISKPSYPLFLHASSEKDIISSGNISLRGV